MDLGGDQVVIDSCPENEEQNYRRSLISLHRTLRQETLCNVESYKATLDDLSDLSQQLYSVFCQLFDHLENIDGVLLDILDFAPQYDFHNQKINGYRSQVKVTQRCLTRLMALVRHITVNKDSYMFRRSHYVRELESYVMVLGQLRDVLHYTRKLVDYTPPGQLIPEESILDTKLGDEIQMEMDKIDQEWFYGRALGFQYCDSLKKSLEVVHIGLATYSHSYKTSSFSAYTKLANSLITSSQYVLNAEHRSRKVVEVTLSCDIEFCKAFWNLTETDLLHNVASLALPVCPVNHLFSITPTDMDLECSGGTVTIPSPSAHIGAQKLQFRLLSNVYREGQEKIAGFPSQKVGTAAPPSRYLIIQFHGGGFVSQTSRTHEAYLRQWANDLKVPILCVDYSLAPRAPFPRALEETYYTYCWALTHKALLGTTAERIVIVGDSAGGNLLLSTMLKAIEDGLRLPDGLVCVYTPVYIQYIPSPSRSLSVMDALLPVGILTKCLEAYAGDHIEAYKLRDEPEKRNSTQEQRPLPVDSHSSHREHTISPPNVLDPEEEEDDEIKSLLLNNNTNPLPSPSATSQIAFGSSLNSQPTPDFISHVINSDRTEASAHVDPVLRLSELEIKPAHGLLRHRRSAHLVHSRTGSMPLSPKVEPVLPLRHDKNRHFAQSPLYKFSRVRIKQNPYLSPLFASDELLSQMPPTYMVAAHLDPCLDDSVMFAKKLDSLGVEVHLDAVDEVPHGFLNFGLVSSECYQACEFCKEKLRQALKLPA